MLFHRDRPDERERVRQERIRHNRAVTEQLHQASIEAREVARASSAGFVFDGMLRPPAPPGTHPPHTRWPGAAEKGPVSP